MRLGRAGSVGGAGGGGAGKGAGRGRGVNNESVWTVECLFWGERGGEGEAGGKGEVGLKTKGSSHNPLSPLDLSPLSLRELSLSLLREDIGDAGGALQRECAAQNAHPPIS